MPDLKDKNSGSRLNPSERNFDDIVNQPDMKQLDDQGDAIARDDEASKIKKTENNPSDSTQEKNGSNPKEPENKYGNKPEKQTTEQQSGGMFGTKKKKGIGALLVGILLTSLLGIGAISPFGAFIHLKEVSSAWADKFNDTGHHTRMKKVYHSRYFGTRTCSGVYCKLTPNRISDVEINKLKAAGLTPVMKYGKIQSFEFKDKADGKVKKVTPKNFGDFYDKNPHFVSLLNNATASPRAITWRSGQALKKFQVFGINRSKIPKDIDEIRKTLYDDTAETRRATANTSDNPDEEQKKNENGAFSEVADGLNDEADALKSDALVGEIDPNSVPDPSALTTDGASGLTGKAASAGAKGIAGGVLALPDATCTTYRFAKALSYGAKAYQARDLIKYAGTIMVVADGAKSGKIDEKQAALVGNLLMKPSTLKASKGKTFAESEGFTLITQGKVSTTKGMARFTNGTPAIEFFDKIINPIEAKGGDGFCKQVKSWYGQAGLFIGGLALNGAALVGCVGTLGAGCGGIVANMGAGVTFQLAAASLIHYMQPTLIAYLAGVIVPDPLTDPGGGYAAGNAIAAGMGAFGSQIGRANGFRTVPPTEYKKVITQTNKTDRFLAQVNKYRSKDTKEYNSNSIATQMSVLVGPPILALRSGNVSSALASVGKLIASAPSKLANILSPVALAADDAIDYYRSDLCNDAEYKTLEIATDGFCNPIYAETKEVLESYSPESVLDYMVAPENDYIDGETGEAKNKYLEYLEICIDGSEPIIAGEKTGDLCVTDTEQTRYFRLYTMDKNIYGGLDDAVNDKLGQREATASSSTDESVLCKNVPPWSKLPMAIDKPIGGPVKGTVDIAVANTKINTEASLKVIAGNQPDFIALNEVHDNSLSSLEAAANGYGAYREPKQDGGLGGGQRSMDNVVMWRKDKWTLLEGGRTKVTEDDMGYNSGNPFTWDRWAAWGIFKRTDGAIVSVISTHMMTNPQKFPKQHGNPEMSRIDQYKESMNVLLQLSAVLAKHGPVLVSGDMNTHADQGPWSAVPMMQNAGFGYASDGAVIYAFHPKGTKLVSSRTVPIPIGSDHGGNSLLAKIDMNNIGPGAIENVSVDCDLGATNGWVWPLQKNLNPGPCYGGIQGHAGMDINSSTTDNIVYAAHNGIVKEVINNVTGGYKDHPEPKGNFIMVETTGDGDKVFYGYQHLKLGSVKVNVGDTVKAGQPLAIAGATGSLSLNASLAHLHITTATTNTVGGYLNLSTTFDPMKVLPPKAPEGYKCT